MLSVLRTLALDCSSFDESPELLSEHLELVQVGRVGALLYEVVGSAVTPFGTCEKFVEHNDEAEALLTDVPVVVASKGLQLVGFTVEHDKLFWVFGVRGSRGHVLLLFELVLSRGE